VLERPKYQPFTESVAVMEPLAPMQEQAGGDTALAMPAQEVVPCVVCGGQVRWNDAGLLRCVACWPQPLTRGTLRAEAHYQRRRRV
jgi:hypothetical protein